MKKNSGAYVVITSMFPTSKSFRGPFIYDQVRAIERNSAYKVILIKPVPFLHSSSDYEYEGVKVYCITDYTLPSNILPNKLSDRLTYHSLIKKLNEIGINPNEIAVCHAHVGSMASLAVRLKRDYPALKTIVQHHGFDVMSEADGCFARFGWHKRLCQRHNIAICNEADINVGVSSLTLDFVKRVPGAKLKDSYVLYNGVDTSLFTPSTEKRHNQVFTIGCIGNFWELKDHITLIKAVELLVNNGIYNLKVIFIGTGYTRQMCEEYIENHGISKYFKFLPTMLHSELPDFYRSLDLFVLPSYWEAFGCVYTEAYACGIPFIGVNGQGISEIITGHEKSRWLVDKGDFRKLAVQIEKSIKNPSERPHLSIDIDIDSLISSFLNYIKS